MARKQIVSYNFVLQSIYTQANQRAIENDKECQEQIVSYNFIEKALRKRRKMRGVNECSNEVQGQKIETKK